MKRVMIIAAAMSISSFFACAEYTSNAAHLTTANTVRDIVNHPAFKSFSERLLTRDDNSSYYNTRLSDVASLMPYHQEVLPSVVVNTLNYMIDQVTKGKTIFYDFFACIFFPIGRSSTFRSLIPRNDKGQGQCVDIRIKSLGQCQGNLDG